MSTFIVGEVGSNHDGDIDRAIDLINIAKKAGCDAVKFQLIKPFRKDWLDPLMEICKIHEIEFMATPFSHEGIIELRGRVKHWKIASPEASNVKFVQEVCDAADGDPVFLSDGCINEFPLVQGNIIPMACVMEYPADPADYHFYSTGQWGLSDHTTGIQLAISAVAHGATVIEKHFTDNNNRTGPDHAFALEPALLKEMVEGIRLVEKILSNKKKTIIEPPRSLIWP